MDNTDIPLFAHDELGNFKYMAPYSGEHQFPGKQVYEYRTDKVMKQGGKKMKFQKGGDIILPPITTSDPGDPRYRAYQDSMNLYNNSRNNFQILDKANTSDDLNFFDNFYRNHIQPRINQSIVNLEYYNNQPLNPEVRTKTIGNKTISVNQYNKPQQEIIADPFLSNNISNSYYNGNPNFKLQKGGSSLHGGDNGLNVGLGNPYVNQTYYKQGGDVSEMLLQSMRYQNGGQVNPYKMQNGGSIKDLYDYLFKEDDEKQDDAPVTAPSISEVQSAQEEQQEDNQPDENDQMLMDMGLGQNPYTLPEAPSNGFRTFSNYQEGKQALLDQLNLYKTGRTKNNLTPDSTLQQAMSVYAPVGDGRNNPTLYAAYIAHNIGVTPNTPISKINTSDWANAIEKFEGNKSGNNNPGNIRN